MAFGVALLGFVELVFEGDDAAGRVDRGALVDQFPHPCGKAQLMTGVTAVAAGGALRLDQPVLVKAAQEPWVVPSMSAARPMV